jgi:hypothetical protein
MSERKFFAEDILLVADFGRSAQGWLSYMLCYILNARFVEPYDLLLGRGYTESDIIRDNTRGNLPGRAAGKFSLVLKSHQFPNPSHNLTPSIVYLTRDPRDVAVSMYHLSINRLRAGNRTLSIRLHATKLFGDLLVARGWRAHSRRWRAMDVLHVRYEDLRHDTAGTLEKIVRQFCITPDPKIVSEAIDQFRFERTYGRKRGVEDKSNSDARKGIIGDYRNYFSGWRHRLFWAICGTEAEKTGYRFDGSTTREPTAVD